MKPYADKARIKANFSLSKLLVIEDNEDQWLLMKQALHFCLPEIAFTRIRTPDRALTLLAQWLNQEWEIPKLILLDLYVPDRVDGWQFLKQLKAMPSPFNLIPVVMLSSSAAPADITESYDLGASLYLVKPTDYEGWLTHFHELRLYWWETVTLPLRQYKIWLYSNLSKEQRLPMLTA